ncbi:methyl-accepting chemotaxis protein [Paenibacillus dendritiformis]|uniref:methyl-accepting chemotaxis protein n=1 Tax=Paenibacillus dendritiformis TaxID=130049 RepID=UPI001F299D16|nr:methyl-accepting chemotaxis protein [Paenibacillus dendritiformis]
MRTLLRGSEPPHAGEQRASAARHSFHPLRSVGMKLFFIFFVSIALLVGSVGLLSFFQARSIIQSQIAQAQEQTLIQVGEKLDLFFTNYSELSAQILLNQDIQAAFLEAALQRESNEYEKLQNRVRVENHLKSYVIGNPTLHGIYLLPVNEKEPSFTSGASDEGLKELRQEKWFTEAQERPGEVLWLPAKTAGISGDSPDAAFGLARAVKNTYTGKTQYIVVVEIYLSGLQERIRWKTEEGAFAQIVDAEGKLVFSEQTEAAGEPPGTRLAADPDRASGRGETSDANGGALLGAYYRSPVTGWTLNGFTPSSVLLQDTITIRNISWTAIAISLGVALLIGWYVIRSIGYPLERLSHLMEEGARGRLGLQMKHRSQDDIGRVAASFNAMMARIGELVGRTEESAQAVLATAGKLTEASHATSQSAEEIALATEEIAHGSTMLAAEAERGNEWTGRTSAQMLQVIDLNVEMYRAAAEVEAAGQRGSAYMEDLGRKTGLTERRIHALVGKVDALKSGSGAIRHILDLLTQIAKQTNILSLNAAIEAARAGSAGRGFLVVADQIRSLADESARAIEHVRERTEAIEREMSETVEMLSGIRPVFEEQLAAVHGADSLFQEVQEHMGLFMAKLDQATEAVNELDETQRMLTEAMTNVGGVAEESAATTEEVASLSGEQKSVSEQLVSLSQELEAVSKHLTERLAQFQLN